MKIMTQNKQKIIYIDSCYLINKLEENIKNFKMIIIKNYKKMKKIMIMKKTMNMKREIKKKIVKKLKKDIRRSYFGNYFNLLNIY